MFLVSLSFFYLTQRNRRIQDILLKIECIALKIEIVSSMMRMASERLIGAIIYWMNMKNHILTRNDMKVPFSHDGFHNH